MVWQLSDINGVEEDLEAMGEDVWRIWVEDVRSSLLQDPTKANQTLSITRTTNDLVWIPGTAVYVRFELIYGNYLVLIGALDLEDLTQDDLT